MKLDEQQLRKEWLKYYKTGIELFGLGVMNEIADFWIDKIKSLIPQVVSTPPLDSLDEEFDKQFKELYDDADDGYAYNEVKSYLHSVHDRAVRETVKKIDDVIEEFGDNPEAILSILNEHFHGGKITEY